MPSCGIRSVRFPLTSARPAEDEEDQERISTSNEESLSTSERHRGGTLGLGYRGRVPRLQDDRYRAASIPERASAKEARRFNWYVEPKRPRNGNLAGAELDRS